MRRAGSVLTAVALAIAAGSRSFAVRSAVWTENPAGHLQGTPESVSFTGRGAIVLAPRAEDLAALAAKSRDPGTDSVTEPIVWCEAVDAQGNLHLGTGNSGRVLRVTPSGETTVEATLEEPEVTAILVSSTGTLYMGTSPSGAVYKLGKAGEATVFYEPDERYIWALAEDSSGNLFVGTGERGRVFKVSPKGEAELLFDSPEPHIIAMVFDRDGSLVAGSAGSGLIYRIGPGKKASVLYDSSFAEIADVAIDGAGNIYAAAVSTGVGEIPAPAPRLRVRSSEEEPPVPAGAEELGPVRPRETEREKAKGPMEAEIEGFAPPESGVGPRGQGGGALLRIARSGTVEELWRSSQDVPYTVAATSDGFVYLGTGEPARLLRVEEPGRSIVVASFPQAELSRLTADRAGHVYAATSNSGAAYRIGRELAESGSYESPVRDAGPRARWGKLRWDAEVGAGQRVEMQTRSGNSSVPDETWTVWSPVYQAAEGSDIASAPGRFIQWRARLIRASQGSSTPILRSVAVSYLPANRPPRIQEVKVLTAEESRAAADLVSEETDAEGKETGGTSGSAATAPKSVAPGEGTAAAPGTQAVKPAPMARPRTVVWHADDRDDDTLLYTLEIQKEGEDRWAPLASNLSESSFSFEESGWPDGRYRVRCLASDAPSNVPGDALAAEIVSDVVILDHTPPTLERLESAKGRGPFQVRATDSLSPIASAEVLAGKRVLFSARPVDGVLDSKTEILEVDVPAEPHPEGLRLRVRDAAANESTLEIVPPTGGR